VTGKETHVVDECQCVPMVRLRLTREADHHVGGELGEGIARAQLVDDPQVLRPAIPAMHAAKHAVAAALQRHVPVGAEARMGVHFDQLRSDVVGVDAAEANACGVRDEGEKLVDQLGERRPEVAPVRAEVDPTEHNLAVPLFDGGEQAGILILEQTTPRQWRHTDIVVMKTIADQMVLAVSNARLRSLMRGAYRRGRNMRAYDSLRERAPGLGGELRVLAGCGWHTVRRACPQGLVMCAHSAGRLAEAVRPSALR